ncbi:MAG: hypothetical protein J1E63_07120 [Muribaculaceae bacterium]|nr:hypothetical protein [Muribaculaceae bacterium]
MKKFYFLLALMLMGSVAATAAPQKGVIGRDIPRKAVARKASSSVPQTLPATDVTPTGFTANWKATPGASLYQVTAFEPITVTESGTYTVLYEGFSGVEIGTFIEPYFPDEYYVNLADYDMVDTPDWQGYLPLFARGMVGGIVYSPYIDLTNDEGRFTVNLSVAGYAGAMVKLTATGTKEETKELYLTTNGLNEFSVEFTCGCHDTYLTFVDFGVQNDPDMEYADKWDFLDDIEIVQNLKAGDTVLRLIETVETPEDSGITSHGFYDMKFLDGACHLAYDVMAISVVYNDPFDDWDYDVYYSDYSALEYVDLPLSGIEAVKTDRTEEVEYFDLRGVKVSGELSPGLYIRRQGTDVSKMLVK